MYGGMGYVGPPRGTFTTLADRSGFSEADCALAARTGRLPVIVKLAELRTLRRRRRSSDALSGAQAMVRLRAKQANWS